MKASKRIRCLVGGHSWEQHDDPVGPLTFCSRCGKLQHASPRAARQRSCETPLTTKNASRYGEGERVSARVRAAGRYFLRVANHAGAESPGSYSVAVRMQPSR